MAQAVQEVIEGNANKVNMRFKRIVARDYRNSEMVGHTI